MPRILLVLTVVLGALYSGYWFVGRMALDRGVEAVLTKANEGRLDMRHDGIAIRGFPSRFDTTLTQPAISSGDQQFGWRTDFFQALMLSYQPGRFILIWPDEQVLTAQGVDLRVATNEMRASLSVGLTTDAPVRAGTFETGPTEVFHPNGQSIRWARGLLAIRDAAVSEPGFPYDLFAEATGMTFPGMEKPVSVRFDGTGMFSGPLGRNALAAPPRLTVLAIRDLTLRGDGFLLTASGALGVDPSGRLTGDLDVSSPDPDAVIAQLLALGMLDVSQAEVASRVATSVAADDGGVSLPIAFDEGVATLAGLRLGVVPQLW